MIFEPAVIDGAFVVAMEPLTDDRGWFTRAWCEEEFRLQGLDVRAVQTNVSFNHRRATIRGLHWQVEPFGEAKLVRCTAGAIFDVMADVRPVAGHAPGRTEPATRVRAGGVRARISGSGRRERSVLQRLARVRPGGRAGIRWDDPAFGIAWPLTEAIVSEKDASWPDYALEPR